MNVFVGLSGGVDSSVAAHLLKEEGHDVTGVFLRTWQPEHVPCTQANDERAAFRAAAHLDIPFLTLDLSEVYLREVGQHFIEGYARGETPNPDVLCNREVKFGAFLRFAKERGADAVATGHYARIAMYEGAPALLRGADADKDQSYFLALVTPELLRFVRFPLGSYQKREVRAIARRAGLPAASRPDSQGICFIGEVDLHRFLAPYIPLAEGDVLDGAGRPIGRHSGAVLYTLGERHGFAAPSSSGPRYVGAIDIKHNTIVAVPKGDVPAFSRLVLREEVVHSAHEGASYDIEVRYRGEHIPGIARRAAGEWHIDLSRPATVACGQAIVAYDGERVALAGILTAAS